MDIQYVTGDATQPSGDGPRVIAHVCNDIGAWSKGFVLALSVRYPEAEWRYKAWHQGKEHLPFVLGQVQFVPVAQNLWVANMIGQHRIGRGRNGIPPVRYPAIDEGLARVGTFAAQHHASVHMPRIGCGLAGGDWEQVRLLVERQLTGKGIAVTVYDLPPRQPKLSLEELLAGITPDNIHPETDWRPSVGKEVW